jgi:hypothetical protein
MPLKVEVLVPEPLLSSLGGDASDLARKVFEATIADQYRNGALTHAEVSELLGLHRFETDGFLKKHAAFRPNELEEYADDCERFQKLAKK